MSATDELFTLEPAANGLGSPFCSAVLSSCGQYRYELWRRWAEGPHVLFIMLNPSTADATNDDATIRKCVAYAKRWGFGALCVGNLFAFRATDPREMKAAVDPVGPDNDATLRRLASEAGVIVAAWGGAHGTHLGRRMARTWAGTRQCRSCCQQSTLCTSRKTACRGTPFISRSMQNLFR